MWSKLTVRLESKDPLSRQIEVDGINDLVRSLCTTRNPKGHSIWYKYVYDIERHGINKITMNGGGSYEVLIPRLSDRTIEVYKDLGFNISQMGNIGVTTRRTHYRKLNFK